MAEEITDTGQIETLKPKEQVDTTKEKEAHEFRWSKVNSPALRAFLSVARGDEGIWNQIDPSPQQQRQLEQRTALPGETHRVGGALFANIYRNPEAAALYDLALFDATQGESNFLKEKIYGGKNFAPLTIVGAGGVYGTIFSAASLKENPNNPPFGFDVGKKRGGIWTISGDVTLDKPWWRMNSRNRPEDRSKLPLPGSEGNLNSLGAETQNLQLPDISSAQYPTNNELGRVLAHDNLLSNNIVVNAELVKVRQNSDPRQRGQYQQEYQDKETGRRFYAYTDIVVQATGLGREDLGFSNKFSATQEVLEEVKKDLREGVKTPKIVTLLQLVEATTSNRKQLQNEFAKFGLVGIGDTSKVIREFFIGIGGIDPGFPAQQGFVQEVVVFGLEDKTREQLARSERARYVLGLLEFERGNGGFFRIRPIDGRVVGVGIPKDGEGVIVYYRRVDQTPEGPVVTYGSEIVPRLVTAAGFEDESDKIYSGLTVQTIGDKNQIRIRVDDLLKIPNSTIFYDKNSELVRNLKVARVDINSVSKDGRILDITLIDQDGTTTRRRIMRDDISDEDLLLFSPDQIAKLEIAGKSPSFKPFIDTEYDSEIPVGEKAEGFEIYKVGACTNLPILDKERKQTKAYEQIPENSKSIFRFVRRTVNLARKLARQIQTSEGALNQEVYKPQIPELGIGEEEEKQDLLVIQIDPRANVQEFSPNLKFGNLLKYLAASRLPVLFPPSLEKIAFGIKRTKNDLAIQFDPPIPKSWEILEQFLTDPIMQRLMVAITRQSTASAQISIGLKNRQVDVRNTGYRSVKNNEVSGFEEQYQKLASLG